MGLGIFVRHDDQAPELHRGIVAVVRDAGGLGRATLIQRNGQVISGRVLFDASIPLLPGFEVEPGFVF